jgi:hypothetical protein
VSIDPEIKRILDERLAKGDIGRDEYRSLLAELKGNEEQIADQSETVSAKAATLSNQWHYNQDGAEYGPVDEAEIIRLIQDSELAPGTPVLKVGSMDWQPARNHACFQVEVFPKKKSPSVEAAPAPTMVSTTKPETEKTLPPIITPAQPASPSSSSKPIQRTKNTALLKVSLGLAILYSLLFLFNAGILISLRLDVLSSITSIFIGFLNTLFHVREVLFTTLLICLLFAFREKSSSIKLYFCVGIYGICSAYYIVNWLSGYYFTGVLQDADGFWQIFRFINLAIWMLTTIVPAIFIFEFVRKAAGNIRKHFTISLCLFLLLMAVGVVANFLLVGNRVSSEGSVAHSWLPDSFLMKIALFSHWLFGVIPESEIGTYRAMVWLLIIPAYIALFIPIFYFITAGLKQSESAEDSS